MSRNTRLLSALLAAGALATSFAALGARPAVAADKTTKVATLACKNGWRGSAGGSYGGAFFSVDCNYDRGSTMIEGVSGTAYSIRAGSETNVGGGAVDCFFSGDAGTVSETCGEVRLSIR
jgi:hypothetical protein